MSAALGLSDMTAVARMIVSPYWTVTAPWASAANLPVSMVRVWGPIARSTVVGIVILRNLALVIKRYARRETTPWEGVVAREN